MKNSVDRNSASPPGYVDGSDQRPYPEGLSWDEAWRQRQRAEAAEYELELRVAQIEGMTVRMFAAEKQYSAVGFLQGILQGLRIGIDDERAKIIDAALSNERYFAT
jgi:hypothetical protein